MGLKHGPFRTGLARFGERVTASGVSLPGATFEGVFTITGGDVIATLLYARVTTGVGAGASNIRMVYSPPSGSDFNFSGLTSVASAGTGQLIAVDAASNSPLQSDPVVSPADHTGDPGWIFGPGEIGWLAAGATSGEVEWYIHYHALEPDAAVTAS